jgi:translocator protein
VIDDFPSEIVILSCEMAASHKFFMQALIASLLVIAAYGYVTPLARYVRSPSVTGINKSPACRTYSSTLGARFKKLEWTPGTTIKSSRKTPDFQAAFSYLAATTVQWSLIVGFLHLLQIFGFNRIDKLPFAVPDIAPTVFVGVFTFFMALRSRVFSPLDNSRPKATNNDPVFKERKRPSWTPPPLAFPFIWLTIACLRAVSTALVFNTKQTLLCTPICAFMGHLCIGDTWNTINNVEKRLGTAVLGVSFVWASAVYATKLYFDTLPLAGKVLAPSCVWLTIASFLVYSIWRMNSLYLNDRSSLFPSKEESFRCPWRLPFTSLTK